MPIPAPDAIKATAAAHHIASAVTADGFHIRHFGLLSEGALRALGILWALCEVTGMLPGQIQFVVTALLVKPSGGHRAI